MHGYPVNILFRVAYAPCTLICPALVQYFECAGKEFVTGIGAVQQAALEDLEARREAQVGFFYFPQQTEFFELMCMKYKCNADVSRARVV